MRERLIGTDYRSILKRLLLVAVCVSLPVIAWAQWSTSSNDIYNSNSGNVGVGTTSPNFGLDIARSTPTNSSTMELYSTNSGQGPFTNYRTSGVTTTWAAGMSTADAFVIRRRSAGGDAVLGSDVRRIDSGGNVGIGITSPQTPLHVYSNSTFGALMLQSGSSASYAPTLYLQDDRTSGRTWRIDSGSYAGQLNFVDNTAGQLRMTINSTGNVGIGTSTPSSKLDIAGDVTISGNISAKYQDLAEWVSTTQILPAGTVVALNTESDNGVVPSSLPYDTHVAGVVSDTPGIILGQAGPGKLKVATTGRVRVHVDTSNGAIRRGDLLVTGTNEGTSMRSEPIDVGGAKFHRPGTLIGKALEPLEDGEGEILVLLSLQ